MVHYEKHSIGGNLMIPKAYADFSWQQAEQLLSIDSPTGYTDYAALWLKSSFEMLGFPASITTKGGILVDLGGENENNALMLAAHTDTLGAMVAEIKGNGRLRLTPLGGYRFQNPTYEYMRLPGNWNRSVMHAPHNPIP